VALPEGDPILRLTLDQFRGPRHGFDDQKPPDFELVSQGLRVSAYSKNEWALGPQGSPVIVASRHNQDKTDYKIWVFEADQPLILTLHVRESLLLNLKESALGPQLQFDGFDSVSPMEIRYPFQTMFGVNGGSARVSIADASVCKVLIGLKETDSAGGREQIG